MLAAMLLASCVDHKKAVVSSVKMNPQDIILFFLDSLQHHDLAKVVTVNGQTDSFKITHVFNFLQKLI